MFYPRHAGSSKRWMILDSQSTVDVFCNSRLLRNVRDAKRTPTLYCNAGKAIITKKGVLTGYGTVSYHPNGIVNILLLYNIQKKHKVTYDSSQGTDFVEQTILSMYLRLQKVGYSSLMLGAMSHIS